MATLNTGYLQSNRGVIKILQIIAAIVVGTFLCFSWHRSCFYDYRLSYPAVLNTIVLIINIVLLILNFADVNIFQLERVYTIVSTVLFLVAAIFVIWFIVMYQMTWQLFVAAAGVIVLFVLFLWDVKILQGEAPN
jgi:hypothetical protein